MTPNDRLSDDELAAIADAFPTHLGEPKRSVLVQRLLSEVHAHRAAALTAADVEALRWLADWCGIEGHEPRSETGRAKHDRALAVLTRLTGGAP